MYIVLIISNLLIFIAFLYVYITTRRTIDRLIEIIILYEDVNFRIKDIIYYLLRSRLSEDFNDINDIIKDLNEIEEKKKEYGWYDTRQKI